MRNLIRKFLASDSAAVAMEYVMLGVIIITTIVTGVSYYAAELNTLFGFVANNV